MTHFLLNLTCGVWRCIPCAFYYFFISSNKSIISTFRIRLWNRCCPLSLPGFYAGSVLHLVFPACWLHIFHLIFHWTGSWNPDRRCHFASYSCGKQLSTCTYCCITVTCKASLQACISRNQMAKWH